MSERERDKETEREKQWEELGKKRDGSTNFISHHSE